MHVQAQFQYVVYTERRVHKSLFLAMMKARRLSDFLAALRTVFANVLFSLCSTVRAETLLFRPPFSWNACTTVGTSVERLIEQDAAVLATYLYNYLFFLNNLSHSWFVINNFCATDSTFQLFNCPDSVLSCIPRET